MTTKKKKNNLDKKERENQIIQSMINSVRRPKEWSYDELVELDPRLSENNDF